jgi:hypothetical protein
LIRHLNFVDKEVTVRGRIVIIFLGIATVLVTAVAGFCKDTTKIPGYEKAAMREVQEIAASAANLVDVYMDARVSETLLLSIGCESCRDALTSTDARENANRVLQAWLKASGAFDAIMLLDKNGLCVAAAPVALVNQNVAEDKAFIGALKGKLTLSDAHKSEILLSEIRKSEGKAGPGAGWTVGIAVPIKVGTEVQGVLMSYLKWSRLVKLIAGVRVGQTGYVFVLNDKNQVIVHPAPMFYGVNLRDNKINLPGLDDAIKRKEPYCSYQFLNPATGKMGTKMVGLAYLKGYGNFPGLGWTVAAGGDRFDLVPIPSWWQLFFR